MLLEMYYNVLLVLFLSASTSLHLCAATGSARPALRRLEEPAVSETAPSDEQNVLGLKRRQTLVTVTLSSATAVTTEVDVVTLAPTSSNSVVVVSSTSTSTSPTSSSASSTNTTHSSTITSAPKFSCDTGFSLCGTEYNGGCCRSGYTCAVDSCIPPATATGEQRTCATGSYLCPASVNYGCCPGGYSCAISQCLATNQVTFTSRTTVVTTDAVGSTVTSAISTVITGSALGKATESNLGAKQSTGGTAITSLTPTASHTSDQLPLSGIAIGGIVAGCVIGILVFVLVGWCTYRRVGTRGNNDPPGGVATTNFYHPNIAPILRNPGSGSSTHYHHTITPEHPHPPKQPLNFHPAASPPPPPLNYHPAVSPPPPPGVVEMAGGSSPFPQNGRAGQWDAGQWDAGQWGGEGAQQNIGELPGEDRQSIHEVEGTTPARSSRRWSRQLLKRGSGSHQW